MGSRMEWESFITHQAKRSNAWLHIYDVHSTQVLYDLYLFSKGSNKIDFTSVLLRMSKYRHQLIDSDEQDRTGG